MDYMVVSNSNCKGARLSRLIFLVLLLYSRFLFNSQTTALKNYVDHLLLSKDGYFNYGIISPPTVNTKHS